MMESRSKAHGILGGKVKIRNSILHTFYDTDNKVWSQLQFVVLHILLHIIMQGQCVTSCYGPLTKTRFTAHNFNPWLYGTVAFTMAYIWIVEPISVSNTTSLKNLDNVACYSVYIHTFIITDANQVIDPHHIHDVSITGTLVRGNANARRLQSA